MARVEAKQAADMPSERISIPYTEVAGMMKVLRTQSGPSRRFILELTRRNIDLEAYLESGVMPGEFTHYMEEVVVVGNVFDHIPMDPVHFSVDVVKKVRVQRHNAHELYQEGYYDEAYPILLNLAKRGFKDSQSRLAYILFNGTENVEKGITYLITKSHELDRNTIQLHMRRENQALRRPLGQGHLDEEERSH